MESHTVPMAVVQSYSDQQSAETLSSDVQQILRCPFCHSQLELSNQQFHCRDTACGRIYPTVDGIPVLINENASIFTLQDFLERRDTYFPPEERLRAIAKRLTPSLGDNFLARRNYSRFAQLLLRQSAHPRVLVIGGAILGHGMEVLHENPAIELIESDVAFGPQTQMICDAHDIPFDDNSIDGVTIQGVLSCVADPYRCVEEIHRVLKKDGLVYCEVPFMQQVSGGRYDFTRFTQLGTRRLFRKFEEIDAGAIGGPGSALAWAYQYFLFSFTSSKPLRAFLRVYARLTAFYLKYFDFFLINRSPALDAASGYYFMGRKSDRVLSDRELVKLYRGAVG